MFVPVVRHSVSVAGVVTDDQGRALLIRRRDTLHWEAPGGVLELDEDIESGLTGVYKNMVRGIIALVFRCEILGGQLALNDEVSGFQWATPGEVKEMADEAFAVRVLDALSELPHPAIRQHDGVRVK
jgi:8-oxo-dGTP diphosphatase